MKKMKKDEAKIIYTVAIGAVFIIVLSAVAVYAFLNIPQPAQTPADGYPDENATGLYNEFAGCLTAQGAAMYGADWCSHCQNQKNMFGASFQHVNYVNCENERDACIAAGIEGFPTWVINGQHYPGEQTLQELASATGCSLDA